MVDSLWGDEFVVPQTQKIAKKVVKKLKEPKDPTQVIVKNVKSKTISVEEKLKIIAENVKRILGKYSENTFI